MLPELSRRTVLKWAGIAIAGTPALVACAKDQTPEIATPETTGLGVGHPAVDSPATESKFPIKDPVTGEDLWHEDIRFAPRADLKRTPLTKPVNLLEHQPPRLESKDGVLDVDLDIKFADVMINGQVVTTRTYNGAFPAPTLVAKPGDTIRIREINNLPPEAVGPAHDINHPHAFNDINLHTHGLNVSPEDTEDNVLLTIHPGETFAHAIRVPPDHPTGTFWYHPHKHGASACHVGSGMAGLLLLTDPQNDIRAVPEVGAAREVDLILQEIYITDRDNGTGFVPDLPIDVGPYFFEGIIRNELTVNGTACTELGTDGKTVFVPEIRMRPGEVQHWRMVHSGIFHALTFAIDKHPSHLLAYDGVTLPAVETVDSFSFVPGQRRDLLVQASTTPGTYPVKRLRYKQGDVVNTWPEIVLFNLIVEGEPMQMGLPTTLNPPSARLPYIADSEVVYKRNVAFNFVDDTERNIFIFTIDGKVFKPGRVDYNLVLGTAEEWTISNNPSSDHPFHIHVNWFQVMKAVDGKGKETVFDPPIWMDTVNIPANGHIVARMRFQNYQGKTVFHCHFLFHEDEGMMALIELIDGSPATSKMTPAGGTFLSNDYQNRVQARFINGSVQADTDVTYQYMSTPTVPSVNPAPALPQGFGDFNTFFSLTGSQGGQPLGETNHPVTIEVKYSMAQVDTHVAKQDVQLYWYDEGAKNWITDGVSVVGRADNLLTVSTKRLGKFAVTGKITPCPDFVLPVGVGPEDIAAIEDNKDSPHAFVKRPFDIAPLGAPDGVLDDKDLKVVRDAQGTFCSP